MNRFRRWTSNRRLRDIGDRIRRIGRSRTSARVYPLAQVPSEEERVYPLAQVPSEEEYEEEYVEVPEGKHSTQRRVRFAEPPATEVPSTSDESLRQNVIDRLLSIIVQDGNSNPSTMRQRAEKIATDYVLLELLEEQQEENRIEFWSSFQGMLTSEPNTFEAFLERVPEDRQQQVRNLRTTYMNMPSFLSSGNTFYDLYRASEFNRIGQNDLKFLIVLATFMLLANSVYSFLEVEDEKHIPNTSNFNGAGTKVEDRVGISLDASSRIGTQPFHIPTDLNDLLASIHDFAYFENNNFDRMTADYQYWRSNAYPNDFLQQIYRYGLIKSKDDIEDIKEIWKTTDYTSGGMLGIASLLRFFGIPDSLGTLLDPREILYRTILPAFYNYRNLVLPSRFHNYRSQPLSARSFALGILPDWSKLLRSFGEKAYESTENLLFGKEKQFYKYHETTVEKWLKYLGSIGTFDKSGVFVLKPKGDKQQILNDYKDFIEEFNDMVRVSDYPEKIANTDFSKEQIEIITNPTRDTSVVKPSSLGFGTVLGWFDFDAMEDRLFYKGYGLDPNITFPPSPNLTITPSPSGSPTGEPVLEPIDWNNLSGILEVDIPVFPPRLPMTPAQPAPVTVSPSPTPTTTTTTTPSPTPTTTTTTTPSPTPTTTTTTTPSPTPTTITITGADFEGPEELSITPEDIETYTGRFEDDDIIIAEDDL
jgi:hypothetical protein